MLIWWVIAMPQKNSNLKTDLGKSTFAWFNFYTSLKGNNHRWQHDVKQERLKVQTYIKISYVPINEPFVYVGLRSTTVNGKFNRGNVECMLWFDNQ